jgi:mevalonate kinase
MYVWEFETPGKQQDFLLFEAKDNQNNSWLSCRFDLPTFQVLDLELQSNEEVNRLKQIFQKADLSHWKIGKSYRIETKLDFDRVYGLGSSSTLITLMSKYLNLNALQLQFDVFGGSGYDAAVGMIKKPIVYWLTEDDSNWQFWEMKTELSENWEVVFLGKKMDSRKSIAEVQDALNEIAEDEFYTAQFDHILKLTRYASDKLSMEASLEMYQKLLSESIHLDTPYVTLEILPVNGGLCKWLGAWGGDMILVNDVLLQAYPNKFENYKRIKWNDLIIHQ